MVCVAPVRYAGAHVGRGGGARAGRAAGTCLEAATTLAAVGAPALRARLDALAAHGRGASGSPEIIGDSPAIAALRDEVARAAVDAVCAC